MARNYYGEKAQLKYVMEILSLKVSSIFRNERDVSEERWVEWHDNPLLYFADVFTSEYGGTQYRKLYPRLEDRIASYISGNPGLGFAYECYQQVSLRDVWRYKTPASKWCNNFNNRIASDIIKLCNKYNIKLA